MTHIVRKPAAAAASATLSIREREVRRHGPGRLLRIVWRQWRTERALARRSLRFRTTDAEAAQRAYAAMTHAQFEAINGRQQWANWRTIPRSMTGLAPDRPLSIIDLGCGSGGSTQVLAFYAPLGSRIVAYEAALPLVAVARRRRYAHRTGRPVDVRVCRQSVSDLFRGPDGRLLPEASVDLANASGLVGHHFDARAARELAAELRRVLRPGGLAMLDVGRRMPDAQLTAVLSAAGFARLRYRRSSVFDRTGQVTFRRE